MASLLEGAVLVAMGGVLALLAHLGILGEVAPFRIPAGPGFQLLGVTSLVLSGLMLIAVVARPK